MRQKNIYILMVVLLCASSAFAASKPTSQLGAAPIIATVIVPANATTKSANATQQGIADAWLPLVARLKADGAAAPEIIMAFEDLGDTYAPDPMATKIIELFGITYGTKKARPKGNATASNATASSAPRVYPGVVTKKNIERCQVFLAEHEKAFAFANATYGVQPEIGVALLFVETRLGKMLGRQNAFWSLASMAATTTPELVMPGLSSIKITDDHLPWLKTKLQERSDWAYNELKALLLHCDINSVSLQELPGSIYGAVGMCQFMPSNLKPYGADGDADGKINLFTPPDAIASLANYLNKHGWRADINRDKAHTLLMRYNKSKVYANTILALANGVNAEVYPLEVKKPITKKKPVQKKKPTQKKKPVQKKKVVKKKPVQSRPVSGENPAAIIKPTSRMDGMK